jgi:hypothetical protein
MQNKAQGETLQRRLAELQASEDALREKTQALEEQRRRLLSDAEARSQVRCALFRLAATNSRHAPCT